ncbi:adenosine deaminase [Thalassotalea mangrovi]|uniref:Adenosine deaminase n=1 Tax=Thalassotalea mangrovi TaxID=2572245 RepID=A0A4U1B2K1_9GAMM|nr:adenosine deaminase [Thalassotalea mangrovi]TKB43338.1 adenosine deaminase [Thalassotalea mangrovi]
MVNNSLPLVDLHRHLDGNIRPKTIWELAEKNNIPLPAERFQDFIPHVTITDKAGDLLEFLTKLDWGVKVLTSLDDCYRVGYENAEDLKLAGIDYAELRFSPYYMAMNHQLPVADVVEAVINGVQQGCKDFGVQAKLIGILSRTFGTEACHQELRGLLAHQQHLVAIDLAGDEYNQPAEKFVEHFNQARASHLQVTVHAGEAAGPESVWNSINLLGASRIGHGVKSHQDPSLMTYLRDKQIAIESCLTSNYQTGTVEDLAKHPITQFLAEGLLVTLNTDDPAVEGVELRHEYQLAQRLFDLSDAQLTQIQENALKAAFLSDEERRALRKLKQSKLA